MAVGLFVSGLALDARQSRAYDRSEKQDYCQSRGAPAMNVRLVVEKGTRRKRILKLPSAESIVGRRQDCDVRIPSNEVSRRHCLLTIHDGCLIAEDLDSVNGTFVNGQRIEGRQIVLPGDHLEIGPVRFVVEYEMTQATLDRIQGKPSSDAAELDALPVAEEEEPVAFAVPEDESLDALPFEDEDTKLVNSPKPKAAEDLDVEPLPVAEEILDDVQWQLPADNNLRDILSQMDEHKPRRDKPT
jgi:pSer/pThr/pTyr-binding forkhead associated (FHA) protein